MSDDELVSRLANQFKQSLRQGRGAHAEPMRTPKRMIVSRWMPVRRSVERMLMPSHSAAIAETCLSKG
jgi:hypothetical protein